MYSESAARQHSDTRSMEKKTEDNDRWWKL